MTNQADELKSHANPQLFAAIRKYDISTVRAELDAGVSPNARDLIGWTALAQACSPERVEIFELLITRGADPFADSPYGRVGGTLLPSLASNGWDGWVAKFLARGFDANEVSEKGFCPLHWAASEGHTSTCKMLLEAGATIDLRCFETAQAYKYFTPLHFAAMYGHVGVGRLLIEHGAKFTTTAGTATVLHTAAEYGRVEFCRELIAFGASPFGESSTASHGWCLTPFQSAVHLGHEELARMFILECGETLRQSTSKGLTIAQLAKKHTGLYKRLSECARAGLTEQHVLGGVGATVESLSASNQAPIVGRPRSGSLFGML